MARDTSVFRRGKVVKLRTALGSSGVTTVAQTITPTHPSVADDRIGVDLADLLCAAAGGGDLGGPVQRLLA